MFSTNNWIIILLGEPLEIKKLAKTIIDKWTRIMTENHINYGRYREEDYVKKKKYDILTILILK